MMVDHSRHVHPQKRHINGKQYNNKSSIPNTARIWKARNKLYSYKEALSAWHIQGIKSYAQSGGNMVETYHRIIEIVTDYLQYQCVGLERIPAMHIIQKFIHNSMRANLIVRKNTVKSMQFEPTEFKMNEDVFKALNKILSLEDLRTNYMNNETGYGVTFFNNNNKDINDHLYGFNWKKSIKKHTRITFSDKQKIWQFIDQHEKDLIKNNGNILNKESLEFLSQRLSYRVNPTMLKSIINKYWYDDDETLYSSDDDKDVDDDDYKTKKKEYLTPKQKKISEYLHKIYTNIYFIVSFFLYTFSDREYIVHCTVIKLLTLRLPSNMKIFI